MGAFLDLLQHNVNKETVLIGTCGGSAVLISRMSQPDYFTNESRCREVIVQAGLAECDEKGDRDLADIIDKMHVVTMVPTQNNQWIGKLLQTQHNNDEKILEVTTLDVSDTEDPYDKDTFDSSLTVLVSHIPEPVRPRLFFKRGFPMDLDESQQKLAGDMNETINAMVLLAAYATNVDAKFDEISVENLKLHILEHKMELESMLVMSNDTVCNHSNRETTRRCNGPCT